MCTAIVNDVGNFPKLLSCAIFQKIHFLFPTMLSIPLIILTIIVDTQILHGVGRKNNLCGNFCVLLHFPMITSGAFFSSSKTVITAVILSRMF